jgi:C4-dicarboxylate transporter DctQ subunit
MSSFTPILGWFQRRAENLTALMLAAMFLTFLYQIAFRYVLVLPITWTNWTVEFVSIAWLWGILFGYAFVVRDTDIIRLDIVYGALPIPARRVLDVITGLICAAILAYTLPKCWDYIDFMQRERTGALRIRYSWVFGIYIPFAVMVIIRCLLNVWGAITGRSERYDNPFHAEGHDYD